MDTDTTGVDNQSRHRRGAATVISPNVRDRLSYLLFPVLLGGAMLVWAVLWKFGGWNGDVALNIVYWGFFALLLLLERLLPFERAWNVNDGQVRNDIVLSIVTIAINSVATVVCLRILVWAIDTFQPLVSLQVWPAHWPFASRSSPASFSGTSAIIWLIVSRIHSFLWRFHSVHHSAPRLCVINTGRFHPVDIVKSVMSGRRSPCCWACRQRSRSGTRPCTSDRAPDAREYQASLRSVEFVPEYTRAASLASQPGEHGDRHQFRRSHHDLGPRIRHVSFSREASAAKRRSGRCRTGFDSAA